LGAARDLLLSADVYNWRSRGGHKRCGGFQPRDAVRFWRGNESVLFLICFTCSDVGVLVHDASGWTRGWTMAEFHPGKERLRGLMEAAFGEPVKEGMAD
jgi:hypothetical protein